MGKEGWDKMTPTERRLALGEAHMMCRDCGAKLYSFDAHQDADRPCPTPIMCGSNRLKYTSG